VNALGLAALLALLSAAPAPERPAVPVEILEAGEISWEPATGRWSLGGGAVLRRGGVTLRARTASYDPATGTVDASGGVLLLEAGRALAAESLHAVLDGPFEARDVVAFRKEGPLDLSTCRTVDEARERGRNHLTVRGRSVSGRSGDPDVDVDRPRLTLCDCGSGAPSWEVRASSADVEPGRRAWLRWPVFWVTPRFLFVDRPVPVLALPVFYVPLADRQSGLLFPELSFARTGFALSQPLFLALSESWDATVTLDQAFGPRVARLANAVDFSRRRVRGTGGSVELRWAPVERASGRAKLVWLHDTSRDEVPGLGVSPPHGERVALTLEHSQRLGPATDLRADVALVNDPLYTVDFTADALLRAAEYRRSSLSVARRLEDGVLAVEAGYHLPLLNLGQQSFPSAGGAGRVRYGLFGADVPVLHRLPSATATLLPLRLAGPVSVSASASVARFAPVRGGTGDEGADGIAPGGRGWVQADGGERDGRWQSGERLAATRAALRAGLRAPLVLGGAAVAEPFVDAFAAGYAFEAGPGPRADARVSGGLALSTRLTRRYGAARHDVEPRVEWRAGTGRERQALPVAAYDELDAAGFTPAGAFPKTLTATPRGGFQQATLSVRNRLAAGPARRLDLTLGQDLDLDRGRAAEAWADLRAHVGPVLGAVEARLHPGDDPSPGVRATGIERFSFLRGSVHVFDRRGDNVHASLVSIGPTGSERLTGGLEPVFDPRPAPFPATSLATVGAAVRASGATVAYDAYVDPRAAPVCAGGRTAPRVFQHSGSLQWDSPCRCFKVVVRATYNECDPSPSFGFQIGLDQLSDFRFGP
jgi:LPS-assembly protein